MWAAQHCSIMLYCRLIIFDCVAIPPEKSTGYLVSYCSQEVKAPRRDIDMLFIGGINMLFIGGINMLFKVAYILELVVIDFLTKS